MWKTRLGYLIFLVMMGFLALLYNNRFTFLIFLTCFALPAAGLIILAVSAFFIKVRVLPVPHTVEKGDGIPLELAVVNHFFLPATGMEITVRYRNGFTGNEGKETIAFACPAGRSGRVKMEFRADYCGMISIIAGPLKVHDFLGLWSMKRRLGLSVQTAVLPEKKLFEDFKLPENHAVYSEFERKAAKPGGDDPAEVLSLREYIPGDRMNRIHWKKSGALDTLFVKELADTAQNVSVILVELMRQAPGEEGLVLLDGILEAAFSMSARLLEQNRPHFIAWYDARSKEIRRIWMDSEEQFYEAIGEIYQCRLIKEQGTECALLYPAVFPGEQYAHMFYVCAGMREEAAVHWAALAGAAVCRLICVEGREKRVTEEEEKQLNAVPVLFDRISLMPGIFSGRKKPGTGKAWVSE